MYFTELNSHTSSQFIGFDSFEGLPEDWTKDLGKGAFSTGGAEPETRDQRVSFVKGWFDATLPRFIESNKERLSEDVLVVHFDADLYSSTMFCLSQLQTLGRSYIAIFDEFFSGHETRALYDYLKVFGAKVEFLGRSGADNTKFPAQVACRISP